MGREDEAAPSYYICHAHRDHAKQKERAWRTKKFFPHVEMRQLYDPGGLGGTIQDSSSATSALSEVDSTRLVFSKLWRIVAAEFQAQPLSAPSRRIVMRCLEPPPTRRTTLGPLSTNPGL